MAFKRSRKLIGAILGKFLHCLSFWGKPLKFEVYCAHCGVLLSSGGLLKSYHGICASCARAGKHLTPHP